MDLAGSSVEGCSYLECEAAMSGGLDVDTVARLGVQLRGNPELRAVFEECLRAFDAHGELAVVVKGSIAKGSTDRYSDIDLAVAPFDMARFNEARDFVVRTVSATGRVLAHFPATHLDLPNLLIFFLERGQALVKVDVEVVARDRIVAGPGALVLIAPADGGLAVASPPMQEPDFAGLHQRFCGWLWYTFTKAARGELIEAADSIDVMRVRALLPCLQRVNDLPLEGYRFIEKRLPPAELAALLRTFPAARDQRDEIFRALDELARMFHSLEPRLRTVIGEDQRCADLDGMMRIIERERRALPFG
ncbi:hypothetical protein ACMHYB_17280 [Sorangium sp. So ce1128]